MATLTSSGVRFAVGDELTSRRQIFPTSTAWVFYQSSAPTGWTRSTTHNNKALRVVSGTGGGSAGTNAFTTTMSSFVVGGSLSSSSGVGGHSLLSTQIASHLHPAGGTFPENRQIQLSGVPQLFNPDGAFIGWDGGDVARSSESGWIRISPATGDVIAGGGNRGASHTHPFSASGTVPNQPVSIAVQYIDIIICTFDG